VDNLLFLKRIEAEQRRLAWEARLA